MIIMIKICKKKGPVPLKRAGEMIDHCGTPPAPDWKVIGVVGKVDAFLPRRYATSYLIKLYWELGVLNHLNDEVVRKRVEYL